MQQSGKEYFITEFHLELSFNAMEWIRDLRMPIG
jgi:hypothetical protein